LLDDLAARGLFVEALADRSEWYRLHPAFRAVLQRPLESDADALPQLHRVAARYFAGQHMIAEAAEQAALAGDAEQAADQLAAIILPIIEQGELARAATWMARLPATQIAARPALVQAQAWLQTLLAAPDANAAIATLKATAQSTKRARSIWCITPITTTNSPTPPRCATSCSRHPTGFRISQSQWFARCWRMAH
jgi:ATP/maltotriose-dependent transcriptional regulator MalT